MRKLLSFSLYALLMLVSNIFTGCTKETVDLKFEEKTYAELYEELKNKTVELEVVIEGKRNMFFFSNNDNIYIYTIRYENGPEMGHIYDNNTKRVYSLERNQLTLKYSGVEAEEHIEKIFNASSLLIYLKLDKTKFEYIETTTITNRECFKYRYENQTKKGTEVFHLFIDKETSLCLKCVYYINDEVKLYFETKKFSPSSEVDIYKNLVDSFMKEESKPKK